MDSKRSKTIIGFIVIILLGGSVGWYIWQDLVGNVKTELQNKVVSLPPNESTILSQDENSEKEVEQVPQSPLPDLDRPIVVTANITDETAKKAREHINQLSSELKKQKRLLNNWLELGIFWKVIGDYEAAEEVWRYTANEWPSQSVATNNLADLYVYTMKDNVKGEEYLLETIQRTPTQPIYYENAYSFYRFVLKDNERAKAILRQGMETVPANMTEGLEFLLESF